MATAVLRRSPQERDEPGCCKVIRSEKERTAFGLQVFIEFSLAAILGILLLETVNYIEHYGLTRKQRKSGRYEVVGIKHSWNTNRVVGRILLFELSRHSDHHYRSNKPYQILNSHPESPQMVTGYPGMMYIALIPPLWFWLMNKKLSEFNEA